MPTHESWVADGTASTSPVTESTPVVEAVAVAEVAAPVAETSSPAAAVETVAAEAAAAGGTPAEVAAAVQEFIEGRLDGKPFQIPKGLELPWKRGAETGFAPLEEVNRSSMLERDYRIKTAALANQRREAEIQTRIATARAEAAAKWADEQNARIAKGYASPEEQQRYENFLAQYRDDPDFKGMVDKAKEASLFMAERQAVSEFQSDEAQQQTAYEVANAITDIGQRYPNVSSELIRQQYATALQLDQLPLSADAIEHLYKQEAAKATQYAAPFQSELDALKTQLAQVLAAQAAGVHNETTRQNIGRAQNPVGAPAGGAPPSSATPVVQLTGQTLAQRTREWTARR